MTLDHVIRPPSEYIVPTADAALGVPRCIHALESAVREALVRFWDEPYRRRAHALARALSGGCKVCGFQESSGLLRSLESLLSLTADDTNGILRSVAERVLEILALLKDQVSRTRRPADHAPEEKAG
jgi:hypothetical protein